MYRLSLILLSGLLLASCANKSPPSNAADICKIFKEKPSWYWAANKRIAKRGGNLHVPMAIIYQESSFKSNARPPMQYFLGVIPTGRASDSYGYSQALKSTWSAYQRATGERSADRNNFGDAFDFVLWYMDTSYTRNGVSKWDGYAQYLNYHEGHGGYSRNTHASKQWLINVARKVEARSKQYAAQLVQCKSELDSMKRGWF